MFNLVKKVFGTQQTRILKKYFRIVKAINRCEEELQMLSDSEVRSKTDEFRSRLQEGETPDDLLVEAYAVVKNVCRRLEGSAINVSGCDRKWDMVPFDVQLVGAIAMHHGSIAEMQTGEGKTLTAALPLYLHSLTGKPTHLVTVNDYLAKRDCEWIGTLFRWLGLRAVSLTEDTPQHQRQSIYAADIVYGTAAQFGFDYLRDNSMATSKEMLSQRGHYFAIIDEVDSILIDEARTPLIISGPTTESKQMYDELKKPVASMVKLQREECNRLANAARKILDKHNVTEEHNEPIKLSKEAEEDVEGALKKLWLVSKGTPTNKTLRRIRENPDLRARLDAIETYYWGEQNKEERADALAELYIIIDEKSNDFELTDRGMENWEGHRDEFTMLDLGDEYAKMDDDPTLSDQEKVKKKVSLRQEDAHRKERVHNIRQLFRAHLLMERDIDYIVDDNKIVIINETTGRPQPGQRFSDGLHQAIEAKEGVAIQGETQTYATITLQNYFRLYDRLAGMTGTAMTEAQEFREIYKLDVLEIPTHRPCQRVDANDEVYMTEREKYNAIVKEIIAVHEKGRPILIGTESVDISEKLSRILRNNKLPHTVLNAKNHAKEAEIIARAGERSAITVATNMAGRGTDIKLGEGIAALGGLHVIGTSRHQSRRIDRQLRGRSARQGDPGTTQFFISFDDSLMRRFASGRLTNLLQKLRPPEGEPISANMLTRSIESAQKRVEQRNYSIRKHTLEYDDVMNKHRQEVYAYRNEIIHAEDPLPLAYEILESFTCQLSSHFLITKLEEGGWNVEGYAKCLMSHFPVTIDETSWHDEHLSGEEIETKACEQILSAFRKKLRSDASMIALMQKMGGKTLEPLQVLRDIVRSILVQSIDKRWQGHLLSIDHLRTEVSMSTVAQKDPLIEFKHQAFDLFDHFSGVVKEEISHSLFAFSIMVPDAPEVQQAISQLQIMGPPRELQSLLDEGL